MTKIKFVAKMTTIGECRGIIIPKAIARLLEKDTRYVFIIDRTEEGFEL